MTPQPNLTDPEYPRIGDVAQAAQAAMYHHLKQTNGLHNTYAVIIVASKTTPGAMQLQGCGVDEHDAIDILRSVLDASDQGNYRTIELPDLEDA